MHIVVADQIDVVEHFTTGMATQGRPHRFFADAVVLFVKAAWR